VTSHSLHIQLLSTNNAAYRFSEYFPEKALEHLPASARRKCIDHVLAGQSRADRYLRFIVEEPKPAIDKKCATLADRDHACMMGSSMGALISFDAISEYPQLFGATACLSTHWLGGFDNDERVPHAILDYVRAHIPDPAGHRIYMDHGTHGLDASYGVYQRVVDSSMRQHGYESRNFQSRLFPGAAHDEHAWTQRLDVPLRFLARQSPTP